MEPVPETRPLEEFASTPVPRLRMELISHEIPPNCSGERSPKPSYIRRSTEPSSPTPRSPGWASPALPYRPMARNTSPFARGHARSRSSQSALAPPPMARAQSLPGVNAAGHLFNIPQRPASPRGSPQRRTLRKPVDEAFPSPTPQRSHSLGNISETSGTIPEDEEPDYGIIERTGSPLSHVSFAPSSRGRIHRPSSPLRNLSGQGGVNPSSLFPSISSPSYQATKFGDLSTSSIGYGYSGYASSSVPSTPTSMRSRSPSISSLETIPDTPDAEEAAIESYRIAQLKAAADEAEGDEAAIETRRKNALDALTSRGRTLGLTYGARDKRKRWSVCGAERRGDLDLETIWED